MFTILHGVCRAVDVECEMDDHGRARRIPIRSRPCEAYVGSLTGNVEWMGTVVRGVCRPLDMECEWMFTVVHGVCRAVDV